jgi:CDP-glucose 4,6-dehydratase
MRALDRGEAIPIRNKTSTRPWQHVLEPLSGYLWLAARLAGPDPAPACDAFNFGPRLESNRTVELLVIEILKHCHGRWKDRSNPNAPHEASLLNLSIEKAFHVLGWSPVWGFEETIAKTVDWYTTIGEKPGEAPALITAQINAYTAAARTAGLTWAGRI